MGSCLSAHSPGAVLQAPDIAVGDEVPCCTICGEKAVAALNDGAERDAWVQLPARAWAGAPSPVPSVGPASLESASSSSSSMELSLVPLEWCHRKCIVQQQMEAAAYRKARASYARAKATVYPSPARLQRLQLGAAAKQSARYGLSYRTLEPLCELPEHSAPSAVDAPDCRTEPTPLYNGPLASPSPDALGGDGCAIVEGSSPRSVNCFTTSSADTVELHGLGSDGTIELHRLGSDGCSSGAAAGSSGVRGQERPTPMRLSALLEAKLTRKQHASVEFDSDALQSDPNGDGSKVWYNQQQQEQLQRLRMRRIVYPPSVRLQSPRSFYGAYQAATEATFREPQATMHV